MAIRLLVSVRNAAEAVTAMESGADIIDVKEPDHGSLGFAGNATIRDVLAAVAHKRPVSAALGECVELTDVTAAGASPGLTFVKLGMAHILRVPFEHPVPVACASTATDRDWTHVWQQCRGKISDVSNWSSQVSPPGWVAVAYADATAAEAPNAFQVLSEAIAAGCAGLLVDTFAKGNGTTLDLLSETQLLELRVLAAQSGLFFALAGQITDRDLGTIRRIRPDIVAVRGAVCAGHDRRAEICGKKVWIMKECLEAAT